ncbi:endo-1,4-beta-xylanase [Pontiella sulfatireligans]|uniref:endo-1,4-beta-xylanase n=1 Tax=Pontiella sulfatireligans TaxID=2750658 RepID=A0A6C2UH12_9BACT|nr:endo-1,4-beta-xylanase [Pontiella sulfatireligans]VGO19219.1 hypothetical protein SCARR_01276 [Pontiella sulfatireligans]
MNIVRYLIVTLSILGSLAVQAATLTPEEVQQYADDLGVVLTPAEQQQIADLVKPDVVPQWRVDAEARIEQHRKADLDIQVVDVNGVSIEGAQVDVKLKDHDFHFSGVLRVRDLTDSDNNLQGISTNRYQEIFQKLYNGVGLNNGLKQKLRSGFEAYLPGFFDWAQRINMPVRGHLLMWPGGTHMTPAVTEKVVALETLWDHVYLSKQYGTAAVTNEVIATVDALAGDTVVVLWSSNVGTEPLETNVTFSGTASVSSILFDRAKGTGPSVGYWISDVLADGTVQVDISREAAYSSVVVYHLRPDGGAISLLDIVTSSQSDVSGLTNSYSFAGTSSGILLEGVSTYVAGIYPASAEWVLVNSKRKSAHSYFNNVSALESIWTHDSSGNTAVCGLAFANARVVGEQEAKLAEPALQQELKDQIQADISEWASLWPVYEWDVINETRDNHRIQDLIGWDQMAEWFKIGANNAVLPECRYLLNEYGIISAEPVSINPTGYTSRRDTMMSHLDILQANDAPLSRIGFQSRMTRGYLDPDVIYDRLDDFGDRYGLPMVGTEFEIRAKDTFPVDETLRAQITEETLTTYFSHPLVAGLTAWTYMTVEDWAMCSYDGTIKLNGLVWYYLHRIRYVTEESATADAAGETSVRGFKGDYDITVHYDGKDYPVEYTLLSNQTTVVMLDDVDLNPLAVEELDTWAFTGAADGVALDTAGTESSVNGDTLGGGAMGSVINEMARFAATGVADEGFFVGKTGASYLGISNGMIQVSWDVVAADFSNSYAFTNTAFAQGGFGIRDVTLGDKDNRALLRYQNQVFNLSLTAGTGTGGATSSLVVNGTTSLSNLHIRLVYDFDNTGALGSFRAYTTLGGGAEVEHLPGEMALHAGFSFEQFRVQFQALNGGNLWQPGDYMDIDNIQIARLNPISDNPSSLYSDWLADQGHGSNTNLLEDANGDGVNNLVTYAIGGAANLPVESIEGSYLQYIHVEWGVTEAAARGLSYAVESNSNLVSGVWSTNDVEVVGRGAGPVTGFESATNRVPLTETEAFIRLNITFTP